MPATWKMYGSTPTRTATRTPTTRSTRSSPPPDTSRPPTRDDVRAAIFAYNHADWYVDSVLLRARLIAGVPADLVGSLTGLTEGRFPVYARARYADDVGRRSGKRVKAGENAANVIESNDTATASRSSPQGAPSSPSTTAKSEDRPQQKARPPHHPPGRLRQPLHVRRPRRALQGLPGAKDDAEGPELTARAESAPTQDTKPDAARWPAARATPRTRRGARPRRRRAARPAGLRSRQGPPLRAPNSRARASRRLEQRLDAQARGAASSRPTTTSSRARSGSTDKVRLRPLKEGSRVIGGTIIGRVGQHRATARRRTSTSRSARPAAAPQGSTRSRSSTAGSCSRPPRSTAPPVATCSTARTGRARCRSARSC